MKSLKNSIASLALYGIAACSSVPEERSEINQFQAEIASLSDRINDVERYVKESGMPSIAGKTERKKLQEKLCIKIGDMRNVALKRLSEGGLKDVSKEFLETTIKDSRLMGKLAGCPDAESKPKTQEEKTQVKAEAELERKHY